MFDLGNAHRISLSEDKSLVTENQRERNDSGDFQHRGSSSAERERSMDFFGGCRKHQREWWLLIHHFASLPHSDPLRPDFHLERCPLLGISWRITFGSMSNTEAEERVTNLLTLVMEASSAAHMYAYSTSAR